MSDLGGGMTRETFVAMVGRASDEQLTAGLAANGDAILGGVFERMSKAFDAEAVDDARAVLEWRVAALPGEEPRRFQLVIADGACTVERDGTREADVVFTIGGVDFLRMVTGAAEPGELFVFGRLRVAGDLFLAARSRTFFVPPRRGD
jgi:predicted lipid carrier protein YhbT